MSDRVDTVDTSVDDDAAFGRAARRMALAGFGLMFVAAMLLWLSFGPTIFVDLATAVVNCL